MNSCEIIHDDVSDVIMLIEFMHDKNTMKNIMSLNTVRSFVIREPFLFNLLKIKSGNCSVVLFKFNILKCIHEIVTCKRNSSVFLLNGYLKNFD